MCNKYFDLLVLLGGSLLGGTAFATEKPNIVVFIADDAGMEVGANGKRYLLRPEVVETLYVLYTVTKDPIYV